MSECVVRMDIDEMPTACGPCKLSCTAICKEWTKVDRKEIGHTKSPNCPIIAILPEGHGRLVDENEVKDWVENWLCVNKYYHPYSSSKYIPVSEFYDVLQRMGEAVPAERSET